MKESVRCQWPVNVSILSLNLRLGVWKNSKMDKMMSRDENPEIDLAVNRAIDSYIRSRKEKVPDFSRTFFSGKGALRLNKKAFGSDLYKAPINILWALPYFGARASSALLKKLNFQKIPSYLERLPVGFETRVQKEINWIIFSELLELPFTQGNRKSMKDALFTEILNQPEISSLFMSELSDIYSKSNNPKFRTALEKNLIEYSKSRTAAADLAGNIITISAGVTMFQKMTPGAMTAGSVVASALAQQTAISNFMLGPTMGSLYYGMFPASASMGLVIASTGSLIAALAVLTSFSGIVTDPIQHKLGIHQRRLLKFIDSLEGALRGYGDSRLNIRAQYAARIFDLLDLFKKAARTLAL
jgi:Family of unknown function (DUF6635)